MIADLFLQKYPRFNEPGTYKKADSIEKHFHKHNFLKNF